MGSLVLCILCLLLCSQCALQSRIMPGGTFKVGLTDEEVGKYKAIIIDHFNKGASGDNKVSQLQIKHATSQVVAGRKVTLTVEIDKGKSTEICYIEIWEQSWLNSTEITKVNCSPKMNKTTRSVVIGGGPNDIHIGVFNEFLKKHNKVYSDVTEYKKRYQIFRANCKKIKLLKETEQGTGNYGQTWFADLSENEFKQYLGLKKPEKATELPHAKIPSIELPHEFDWRHYNVVTPVKNQGSCGSCWAFSVTGNIEGQWALRRGQLLSLSEQELVDCDTADNGCGGGYMTTAYDSIVKLGGLETEKDYPYEAEGETCSFNRGVVQVTITGGLNITTNETGMAQWLVKNGPMSVGLNANAMQFYMGGVSHPFKVLCSPDDIDHGVLIVGYGVHTSKVLKKTLPYWIVKNSWGTRWGELGYYRLYRGDGSCGINQMVSSAIVN